MTIILKYLNILIIVTLIAFTGDIAAGAAGSSKIKIKRQKSGLQKIKPYKNRIKPEAAPSLKITHFYKRPEGAGSTLAVSPGRPPSNTGRIGLGDDITLKWIIEGCNVGQIKTTIKGVTGVNSGAPKKTSGACFSITGEKNLRPSGTTTYTLVARAMPAKGHGTKEIIAKKTFRVEVLKPVLELLKPEVNQETLDITFFIRNKGNVEFRPTPITVNYEVYSGRTGPRIMNGRFTTPRIGLNPRRKVELGSITLPDRGRALSQESIRIRVNAGANYAQPLESVTRMFHHSWSIHTFTLNNSSISRLGRFSVCEVKLNNYDPDRRGWPATRRIESLVYMKIIDVEFQKKIPIPPKRRTLRIKSLISGKKVIEKEFAIFLNEIKSFTEGRPELFFIRDGKIGIHLEFANRGTEEVKIGLVKGGEFKDWEVPDIDIRPFGVDILLTPEIRDGRTITYTDTEVMVPDISARLSGRFEILNPFIKNYLNRYVRDTIKAQFKSILDEDKTIEAIEKGIMAAMPFRGDHTFTRLLNIRGRGSSLVIEYL